jgi:glycosyltransferase involved in cell wall biosynthesis
MKVAILTPFYRPSLGGVEYIAYHVAKELVKQGLNVHVITTNYNNYWEKISDHGVAIEEEVVVHRLRPLPIRIGYATIMDYLKRTLKEIHPDIVHCHNLHPHTFQALKWKYEMHYKLVIQLHNPIATGIDNPLARLIYKPVMKALVRRSDKVDIFIAHTQMEKEWLINEGIKEDKVVILRFPCIPDQLLNYRSSSNIHDALHASKVITYISRIHPRKGQHLLIKAIKYLKQELDDFKVYIAGPPANVKYIVALKDLIEKYELQKYVFLDSRSLPEKEKMDIIASSDVFALTSLQEYTPVILLEAVALKTPVVATSVGAIPELLSISGRAEEIMRAQLIKDSKDLDVLRYMIRLVNPEPHQITVALKEIFEDSNCANYRHMLVALASLHSASYLTGKLVHVYFTIL